MKPPPGMAIIAEYTSSAQAELAVALLWDAGFEGTVVSESSDPMFLVAVAETVADHAQGILMDEAMNTEIDEPDAEHIPQPLDGRPVWFRWAAWSVFWAIPGAFMVAILVIIWLLLDGLFP